MSMENQLEFIQKENKMGSIRFVNTDVYGFIPAITAMRNPKCSWDRSDSGLTGTGAEELGKKDLVLAKSLVKAGTEHSKFLRQIQVWVDVFMPRYWWQEADTYHFGSKNSCSTMHSLHREPFTMMDFYLGATPTKFLEEHLQRTVDDLNTMRNLYLETHDFDCVLEMKRMLPESFIQLRSWNTNYAELLNIYKQRKNHALKEEWGLFCKWCESLPYFKEMCLDE